MVNPEPFARVPAEQLTVPVPPTGGAEHEPTVVDTLWNVVPFGTTSVATTFAAASAPLFYIVMV